MRNERGGQAARHHLCYIRRSAQTLQAKFTSFICSHMIASFERTGKHCELAGGSPSLLYLLLQRLKCDSGTVGNEFFFGLLGSIVCFEFGRNQELVMRVQQERKGIVASLVEDVHMDAAHS